MSRTKWSWSVSLLTIFVSASAVAADDLDGVKVLGSLGLSQSVQNSCIAIWVPVPQDMAISGIKWYNNDAMATFPEVLVQSGTPEYPVALTDAYSVAANVSGPSSGWGEVTFSGLVGSASGGLYVIFRVPDGVAATADGVGGGPALGYTNAASGLSGWLSADGVEWEPVHPSFGFAAQPVLVAGTPGMTLKSKGKAGGTVGQAASNSAPAVVTSYQTILLPASPNPFNPQTTLKYSVRETSQVDLCVFNVRGELVNRLVAERKEPGEYTVVWDGRDRSGAAMASGVYFARFLAGNVAMSQRLVLLQ